MAIVALAGSFVLACNSDSGGGGANDDSPLNGWNGGKRPTGGGGATNPGGRGDTGPTLPPGGGTPTLTAPTTKFFVGATADVTYVDVTITGANLTAVPTFTSNDTGIVAAWQPSAPALGSDGSLSGTIRITYHADVTQSAGYASITISSTGATSKIIKVYTFATATNGTLEFTTTGILDTIKTTLETFYTTDTLAIILADVTYVLHFDELDDVEANGVTLGYSDVTFTDNPFAAASPSATFDIEYEIVTGTTASITVAANQFGTVVTDTLYDDPNGVVIDTDVAAGNATIFQGIEPDFGTVAISVYWKNSRVAGRTPVTTPTAYSAGAGKVTYSSLAAFKAASGATATIVEKLTPANTLDLLGSIADAKGALKFNLLFAMSGKKAQSATDLTLWLIKAGKVAVTSGVGPYTVPVGTGGTAIADKPTFLAAFKVKWNAATGGFKNDTTLDVTSVYWDGNSALYNTGTPKSIKAALDPDTDFDAAGTFNGGPGTDITVSVKKLHNIDVTPETPGDEEFTVGIVANS